MLKKLKEKLQDKYALFCPYFWRDGWYAFKCFFKPKNKWATDVIPNTWMDKDGIFEAVLFAGIIHYVEGEKGLENVLHEPQNEKMIKEAYSWVKIGRDLAQKHIEEVTDIMLNYEESKGKYEKVRLLMELEAKFYERDTFYLRWIVENRAILWT